VIDTFIQLADGKLNGQKAFMTGALKVKGNVMLAVSLIYSIHFTPVYECEEKANELRRNWTEY
jgi:putative sterol carrier protein